MVTQGSVPATTAPVEPTGPTPASIMYTTPLFPSSPSSTNTFGISSSLGSLPLPLTLAASPTSEYIDELLGPASPTPSMYTGLTTPICVTIITSLRSKHKDYIIYHTDPAYEEARASLADDSFLHQYRGCYYNIPAVVDTKTAFYCVTKGTHIGVFNQ